MLKDHPSIAMLDNAAQCLALIPGIERGTAEQD
jgi:hypothetical protein